MQKIVSELNQNEYNVSDVSDFMKIKDFAKEKLQKDLDERLQKPYEAFDAYKKCAYSKYFVEDVLEEMKERTSELSYDDVQKGTDMARDFLDNMPVSLSDAVDAFYAADEDMCDRDDTYREYGGGSLPNPVLSDREYDEWEQNFANDMNKALGIESDKQQDKTSEKSDDTKDVAETKSTSNTKSVMLPISKSLIKTVKNKPDVKHASIGLNSEHGEFGRMFFPEKVLKNSKTNPNIAYLPMNADKPYRVTFGNSRDNQETVMMTGKEIADANHSYMKAQRESRIENLENKCKDAEMENSAELDGMDV